MKISILGYGVFGSAIGSHLFSKGHNIIKENIEEDTDIVLIAVPSFAVTDILLLNRDKILDKKIIICSKGFDKNGELFSSVLSREFPNNKLYFLYGPTIAEEIKDGLFSVMVLAGGDGKEDLKKEIESDNLLIEISDDVVGVQVGAALKNTVGIFVGIVEGAGFGENTQGFIYSKGLQDIQKVGVRFGAHPDTFLGFTCAGDLFLRSRSRILGIEIGKGRSFVEVSKEMTYPKEGIASLKSILKMENIGIDLTFFIVLNSIIFENMPVKEAIKRLADTIK
jgi:glycerol-3-phosphate dehydrogenase (NAD(P)+)